MPHREAICAECCYAECRYAECRYTECRYAECRYAECRYAECHYAMVPKLDLDKVKSILLALLLLAQSSIGISCLLNQFSISYLSGSVL